MAYDKLVIHLDALSLTDGDGDRIGAKNNQKSLSKN